MAFTRNSTAALLSILMAASAWAQNRTPDQTSQGPAEFLVFIGGKQVGREQVNVARSAGNWIITSTGRLSAPLDITINRFEAKYTSDWQPLELHIEAAASGRPMSLTSSFGVTTAVNEITESGKTTSKTDQISARTVILPNNFFGAYEALAARLAETSPGSELPVYIAPQTEIRLVVKTIVEDDLKGPSGTIDTRRYDVTFQNPGGPLPASITIDNARRLVRVDIPAAGLSVVRSDAASVSMRQQTTRNPTDVDVRIPGNGFTLAGTITTPPQVAGRLRHPAVILVGGSGPVDREATVAGVPIFTQLAGALAERGFLVVRYDKRGVGQSGGRIERVTLQDYAEDVRAAVNWLRRRKDVDRSRLTVVGHSEGGAVAMLAAARTGDIKSLVLVAAPGTTGYDLVLEQQRRSLELLKTGEDERKEKIELQERIQTAVLTGVGWEGVPKELRDRADTPWFRSFLEFDPADVMPRIRQPILIIQPELDRQVPTHHGERLIEMARQRKRQAEAELVTIPAINHLLVPAETGEVGEYPFLKQKTISPQVAQRIADWLAK